MTMSSHSHVGILLWLEWSKAAELLMGQRLRGSLSISVTPSLSAQPLSVVFMCKCEGLSLHPSTYIKAERFTLATPALAEGAQGRDGGIFGIFWSASLGIQECQVQWRDPWLIKEDSLHHLTSTRIWTTRTRTRTERDYSLFIRLIRAKCLVSTGVKTEEKLAHC